jgi:hypothetical protein
LSLFAQPAIPHAAQSARPIAAKRVSAGIRFDVGVILFSFSRAPEIAASVDLQIKAS